MSVPSEHKGAPPRALTADEERIGQVIDGRYRLDAVVGRGGMGVVYKATHVGIHRVVALKLLHPTLAMVPDLRQRFEREARAIGIISHPNCVDVTDYGELPDGSLYLIMEYLEGVSLGDVLDRERGLDPRRALRILRHVLNGLGHAHQVGIIHRDVKPENVFLVTQGADTDFAKILDFGIAKLVAKSVDDGVKLTQAGVAFGTPIYMSPEQALGNPVDGRADLYAASVMAYEMVCGKPPFYSDDKLEVLSMHTARPVPAMDEMRRAKLGKNLPALHEGVERVILKGLAKQPRDRWQTAQDYIAEIDEVLIAIALEADGVGDAPTSHFTGGQRPLVSPTGSSLIGPGKEPMFAVDPGVEVSQAIDLLHSDQTATRRKARTGLTPADRVRKHWKPIVIGVLGLVLILLAIVIATRGDDAPAALSRSALARQAFAELDSGDPAGAIRLLEKDAAALADDASAQLVLGHAYAAQRKHGQALVAYQRALELEPTQERDPTLRANLSAMTTDKDMTAAMNAYELLIKKTKVADAEARLLAAVAGADPLVRRAAAAQVERMGLSSKVDWIAAYTRDLEDGEACTDRKPAVEKLRALGDPRAVPVLQGAIDRKGKSGKYKGKPVNGCLTDAAKAAIEFLQQLSPDAGAPR